VLDGAYHHVLLHLIYLLPRKKLQSVLNFGQNVSWKHVKIYWKMEIIPADLLDTLKANCVR